VPAYPDEDGVDPTRNTETYAEVTLEIETARWRGTPFILRGGKALRRRRKGVRLRFRSSGHEVVNELWIGIDGPSLRNARARRSARRTACSRAASPCAGPF